MLRKANTEFNRVHSAFNDEGSCEDRSFTTACNAAITALLLPPGKETLQKVPSLLLVSASEATQSRLGTKPKTVTCPSLSDP